MIKGIKKKVKSISHFLWLFILIIISFFVTYFYEINKKTQYESLKKTLNNLYFQKAFEKITAELDNRYNEFEYIVKSGDSYESIIDRIKISKKEKKLFLETIKKNKKIKILRPNQKIYFKIDKKISQIFLNLELN